MINLIGLCRHILEEFLAPTSYDQIYDEMKDWLEAEPDQETEYSVYKALVAKWKRGGWAWDEKLTIGAVRLNDGEAAIFEDNAITLQSNDGALSVSLARGEKHDRILWF